LLIRTTTKKSRGGRAWNFGPKERRGQKTEKGRKGEGRGRVSAKKEGGVERKDRISCRGGKPWLALKRGCTDFITGVQKRGTYDWGKASAKAVRSVKKGYSRREAI